MVRLLPPKEKTWVRFLHGSPIFPAFENKDFSKYSLDIKLDHNQMRPRTVRHKLKYGWIRDHQKIVTVVFR